MKISLISDVHAEFYKFDPEWLPPLPDNPDVLVLAGDLHTGESLITFLNRVSNALPETHLIVVAGNHEFYRQIRSVMLCRYREAFESHPRIHFLDNDFVEIGGVRFIGSTLWTGFPLHSTQFTLKQIMAYANDNVADFALIRDSLDNKISAFTPDSCRAIFDESKRKIEKMLAEAGSVDLHLNLTHFCI